MDNNVVKVVVIRAPTLTAGSTNILKYYARELAELHRKIILLKIVSTINGCILGIVLHDKYE